MTAKLLVTLTSVGYWLHLAFTCSLYNLLLCGVWSTQQKIACSYILHLTLSPAMICHVVNNSTATQFINFWEVASNV